MAYWCLTMWSSQRVLGFLLLVAVDAVFSARPQARSLDHWKMIGGPHIHEDPLRGHWELLQGPVKVESLRAPLASNLVSSVQSKQEMLSPVSSKVDWKFPLVQEKPAQLDVNFQLHQPQTPNTVAVQCFENGVHVEVKQDFFGTGHLLEPSSFSLGGCGVLDVDTAAGVLIFQSALQDCGSQLVMTEDELVYVFTIDYKPAVLPNIPVARSIATTVGIECHYSRKHNVSSSALLPAWTPYAATAVAEDVLVFSLKLMTDDWMYERPTNVFFLGDIFNIEASVSQYNHVPLRVFVDACVATATPDVNSAPAYSVIENHGCLTDAKYTGSSSKFLPRVQDNKLRFQLEAFRFQKEISGFIYITCLLKATVAAQSLINEHHKACSFIKNGWVSADGGDQVCACCDTSCGQKTQLTVAPAGIQYEGKAQVGPFQIPAHTSGIKVVSF
ncbi:zona pellucida sperm-binding protein 3a.1 precursor [Danio rerio]|uniref:Zona pellucida sperm-binding protein 3 n=1 Tax=Danio rerio TaxID=7955 RepID=Q5TYP5_DANRE|nr:zona pellucida sperm-binding protein 3a.1 precursor [Danio rerio]|eukprot:NP_001013289.1 zona pellucida glycoprotein 3a precursor [Danio rerio]